MTASYLTQTDLDNYGHELIDVTQRAALHAVAPELQEIRNQNAELQRRLAIEARHRLDQQVAAAVPDYQTIDRDSRWHRYLLELDPLSGRPRQLLLNDAIANGDANRVRAFFDGFKRENPTPTSTQATSSRSRSPSPAGQIYTREMIRQLYEQHRKGAFTEAAWAKIESDLFAAQHENRIQSVYLTK
jgi:hypothetical protein